MAYSIDRMPERISIGRETETGVTDVMIDCGAWVSKWPGMTLHAIHTPEGGAPYILQTETDGGVLVWHVTDADTATPGTGSMEIVGETDGRRKVSAMVKVYVAARMSGTVGEPPEAAKPWVESVIGAADRITGMKAQAKTLDAGIGATAEWDGQHGLLTIGVPKGEKGEKGPQGEKGEPGKDAVVDATLTQSGQAADAKATGDTFIQLKDDMTAITPDDTVVDGKPWTSKKTVDSLCMPIEATGNPVQVYPVEGYPLGVKVSWEPTQAGSGDPSPDNIRPITGRDAVIVTRCGKNLLKNKGNMTINGIKWAFDEQGLMSIKGTIGQSLSDYYFFGDKQENAEAFTTREDLVLSSNYITNNNNNIFGVRTDAGLLQNAGKRSSVSIPSGTRIYGVFMRVLNAIVDYSGIYAQLELGSTATAYEPYTGSTTDIALPETVYGGTLDVETGVLTVTHGNIAAYAGESIPGDWISDRDVYASDATPTTGAQVVYKLETPYTIKLTPRQIAALSGVNTLYTNAGTLTVTGREDPRHTIVELKNAIISLGGNI